MEPHRFLFTALLALGFASLSYGQGTLLVENVNGDTITPIYLPDGVTQVKGPGFSAKLFYAGNQVSQIGDVYPFAANGRFTSGTGFVVPGTKEGGTAINLTLYVWDNSTGPIWEDAVIKGFSPPFDNPLGGGTVPPPKLVNLPSFSLSGSSGPVDGPLIPEPSTIALGLLGMAALLVRFRK